MRGPFLHSDRPGLNPASKQFFADRRCKLSRNTRKSYVVTWRLVQQRFPEKRFNEFTEADLVSAIFNDDEGRPLRVGAVGFRESTVRTRIFAVRCIFGWGVTAGVIVTDPTVRLGSYQVPARNYRRHVWLKQPDIDAALAVLAGEDVRTFRNRLLFQFMLGTGLRSFEVGGCLWKHLDERLLLVADGKGHKSREVAPTKRTYDMLDAWRRVIGSECSPNRPIVPSIAYDVSRDITVVEYGTPLLESGIRCCVTEIGERIGLGQLRPHDLRRSHAGMLEDQGVPVQAISRQLGHRSLNTTMTYLEDNPTKRADAIGSVSF